MQATKKLTWGAGVVVLIILIYSLLFKNTPDYIGSILEHRAEVDTFMGSGDSPLPDTVKSDFQGLNYFEIKQEFKVKARLEMIPDQQTLTLGTSDGATEEYVKYANAKFELSDISLQLLVLKSEDDQGEAYFFIPFSDLTSGEQTYGGGRYLEIPFSKNQQLYIDFNLAFSPYCAYNAKFSCPLPPAENHLQVAITAGERNFR